MSNALHKIVYDGQNKMLSMVRINVIDGNVTAGLMLCFGAHGHAERRCRVAELREIRDAITEVLANAENVAKQPAKRDGDAIAEALASPARVLVPVRKLNPAMWGDDGPTTDEEADRLAAAIQTPLMREAAASCRLDGETQCAPESETPEKYHAEDLA